MAYRLRGENEAGDPVEVVLEFCWRCGVGVNMFLVSMDEHVESAHPVTGVATPGAPPVEPDPGRHALDE